MMNVYFRARGTLTKTAATLTLIGLTAFVLTPMAAVYAQTVPQVATGDVPTQIADVSAPATIAAPTTDTESDTESDTVPSETEAATETPTPAETATESVDTLIAQATDVATDVPAIPDAPELPTGTIAVCKVVLDANGTAVAGDAGSTFSVSITDGTGAVVGTATFDTPLSYDADLLTDVAGNDAQCQTVSNLTLAATGETTFSYKAETITGGSWDAPRYDDTLTAGGQVALSSGDLAAFGAQESADGAVSLSLPTDALPALNSRVLLVVNQEQQTEQQPEQPALVENSCVVPDALSDTTADDIHDSGETTVQEILNDNGYSAVDAMADQQQYQTWHVVAGQTVTVDATFLSKIAGHGNVFGYYTNGDLDTFVPLFKKGTAVGFASVPEAAAGDTYSFTVPDGATELGFAIKSFDGSTTAVIATQHSLNADGADNVAAYNPSSNEYVLAFEDLLSGSDYDFNDMVVSIHIDCTDTTPGGGGGGDNSKQCSDDVDNDKDGLIDSADPGCHTDGDATNVDSYDKNDDDETDVGGTGGGSLQCVDGLDNDGDGLIDSADPGCHTDNNANNAASYDATDNDETDQPASSGGGGSHHSSRRSSSVPSTPEVLGAEACTEYIHTYIKLGKQNNTDDVSRLQTFLNDYMDDHLTVSGMFDAPTFTALKAFQVKEKGQVLVPWVGVTLPNANQGTGWLYKTTKRWINMIKCPELNIPMPELTIDPQDL